MPEQRLIAQHISADQLRLLCEAPILEGVYAERVQDIVLMTRDDFLALDIPLSEWKHGRAFAPSMEVAWWRKGDGSSDVRLTLLEGQPPAGIAWQVQPGGRFVLEKNPQPQLLIGERNPSVQATPPAWMVARVPRPLYYPVAGDHARVMLVCAVETLDGMPSGQRLVELTGV